MAQPARNISNEKTYWIRQRANGNNSENVATAVNRAEFQYKYDEKSIKLYKFVFWKKHIFKLFAFKKRNTYLAGTNFIKKCIKLQ